MLRLRNFICIPGCKEEQAMMKSLKELGFETTTYDFGNVKRISYGADDAQYRRIINRYNSELKELNA